jgi:deazaflavin-dependent oxidoreductase (nitroreductase family)
VAPPLRLLRLGNPVVRAILASPAHALLSGSLVLLEYAGRRTGTRYRIPVMGAQADDGSVVALAAAAARKQWWRTVRPSGRATLVVRRERRAVEGRLLGDPAARRTALRAYLARFPRAAGPLSLPANPTDEQLDGTDAAVVVFAPLAGADGA